ncbi:MAG TPA: gfo/Idh/MocA family oxidoreductase, partial [Gemmataceae bacterium]|nr:gfo/Idh/MocA family oxidoreductase [Gemmataceae bacterium]
MTRRITRRQALAAGAASLGYLYAAPAVSTARIHGAADKLRVAGIGVGGKGRGDIEQAGSLMDVVAICDVDETKGHLGWAAEKWSTAKQFSDYRKLFDDS